MRRLEKREGDRRMKVFGVNQKRVRRLVKLLVC